MDSQVLEKLQFHAVRELLAARCRCRLGRELALRISPSGSPTMVNRWLDQVREMTASAETIGLPPLGSARDIRTSVEQSAQPAGLEPEALADVASTLEATGLVTQWGAQLPADAHLLRRLVDRVGDFTPVGRRIQEAIDERGQVRDLASPRLASIRATIAKARDQIDVAIKRLLRQSSVTRCLQYAGATFHNDRRVLPLKSEHRGRIDGIVHRSSDSGATLFVEPTEAVEMNNSIVRLGLDEHKEITRILGELSRLVHMNAEGILKSIEAIAVLDVLGAKVRYAKDYRACIPQVSEDGKLELIDARHPVLEKLFEDEAGEGGPVRKVVPIGVRLGDDFDLLVITGPNTGGKTVALKTVGLLALMAQAGIPIPAAAGSRVPVYRNVFVDVGDEQSIEQSLSTFSSHMSTVLSILQRAGRRTLVLVDELGAGTDPDEGAAIGRAVMEDLLRLGVTGVVTTHLSVLKAVAYTEKRVDNASVEFDVETLQPLYHVRIGEPGNSNALIIAERLGMAHSLVERAQSHLSDRHRALSRAIEGTLASRRRAERARADARKARLEAERRREDLERQTKAMEEARREHERWVAWINSLSSGDEVYVRSFERVGRIVRMQLHQQTAVVSAGALDFEIALRELAPPEAAAP